MAFIFGSLLISLVPSLTNSLLPHPMLQPFSVIYSYQQAGALVLLFLYDSFPCPLTHFALLVSKPELQVPLGILH